MSHVFFSKYITTTCVMRLKWFATRMVILMHTSFCLILVLVNNIISTKKKLVNFSLYDNDYTAPTKRMFVGSFEWISTIIIILYFRGENSLVYFYSSAHSFNHYFLFSY